MIKLLYSISLLVLISASLLFVLSVTQWGQDSSENKDNSEISIVERYKKLGASGGRNNRDVISPLVKQASAYALYLNPPKPPAPKTVPRPTVHAQPVNRTVDITPKFRLLATTYYRSSPDKSLALVSEPGKGDHWVKKGERLGHFMVESVEKEGIFYRDGNQTREMKITKANTVQLAQIKSSMSATVQSIKPNLRLMNTSLSSEVE